MRFAIRHTACKFLPANDILHLIKEDTRFTTVYLLMALDQEVEIRGGEVFYSLILKIEIEDIRHSVAFLQ